ncbi:Germin-like protein subfamily 2 member 1 [Raphanus sativus]|uniref:Germin-like protein n=1 Tax=Raphanus sativus TaxID=3726 RepID=A0A6J0KTJ8_RAPSA|nr:germin-like protein subfamily 2 member 1 [Raphanus sativus]XP_018460011.1 germin-like protein subfamily 2 member 1 [Raphanus sativus]KAJ4871437.1 Germin-like protein subfamily 2 member 1 [Raphanus sativus]KAJ4879067.1 Germin-like protein subfamily 2 member 1 [Raphanus sativus]
MASPTSFLSIFLCLVAFLFITVSADPDMLQDLCVADLSSGIKVNGFPCKDAANVTSLDFFSQGIANPGLTNNTFGALVTGANVMTIPGLNTLGVSLARIDYAPGGLNPPHTHPRATEVVYVLEGTLDVGFLTTANRLISQSLKKGDVFAFPRGLVHFQKNNGRVPAAVIAAFNSQLPGTQSLGATLFGSTPPVPDEILSQAFQTTPRIVKNIKSRFQPKK